MSEVSERVISKTLDQLLPEIVVIDSRPGYQGYVVSPENLLGAVKIIKEELHYDYLSCLTAVDYIAEEKFEVVYHFYRTTGGGVLVLKTRVPRDDARPGAPRLDAGADATAGDDEHFFLLFSGGAAVRVERGVLWQDLHQAHTGQQVLALLLPIQRLSVAGVLVRFAEQFDDRHHPIARAHVDDFDVSLGRRFRAGLNDDRLGHRRAGRGDAPAGRSPAVGAAGCGRRR